MLNYFLPDNYSEQSIQVKFHYRFFVWATIVSIVAELFYFHKYYVVYEAYAYCYFIIPSILMCVFALYLFKCRGQYFFPAVLTCMSGYLCMTALIYSVGGIKAPGIVWFAILALVAGTIIGKRAAIFSALFSLITITILVVMEKSSPIPSLLITEEDYVTAKIENLYIFTITMFFFVYTFAKHRQQTEESMIKKNHQVENLLRILVHDIATPMQIFKSKLKKMQRGKEVTERDVEMLSKAMNTLEEITNDVRTLKAIEDKKTNFNIDPCLVNELLKDLKDLFKVSLENKKVSLEVVELEEDCYIEVDPSIFKNQVLNNLISNAIKFSNEGKSIIVTAKVESSDVFISVKDSGIGMPESLMQKVFSFEEKTSRTGTGGESGTGFGLPLVKDFVNMFHGEISVTSIDIADSPIDHGTTFTMRFQKVKVANEPQALQVKV